MKMQQYCLRWNNHQPNFISVFSTLLNSESLVDVTLSADGKHLQAHKLVLSACSSYFQSLFTMNPCQHPIVILKDVKFTDLKVIIDFMYYGEVNVSQEELPHILKTAEALKIKGLAEIPVEASLKPQNRAEQAEVVLASESGWTAENQRQSLSPSSCPLSPASKRKRLRKSSTGSGSTEKHTSEEHSSTEVTLSSPGFAVIKPDANLSSNPSTPIKSSPRDSHSGYYESTETPSPQQINLHIPQEIPVPRTVENTVDMSATATAAQSQAVTDRVIITTHAQLSQSSQYLHTNAVLGTKRSRILMRQSRIKKDGDQSDVDSAHYLSVPHLRVERQVSDPFPTSASPPPGQHLAVPGNVLVKQHSHPLLPSQISTSPPPPLTIPSTLQIIPHPPVDENASATSSAVVMSGGGGDQSETTVAPTTAALRVKSEELTPTSMKVRTDELKRSVSSPSQTNTRSSHCPVVRPGPALGCNYCWNTVDTHGRILRRKTKYHCPECQTNLCIVPCFQEYHERHVTDPLAVPPSTIRLFPKTTSM